MPASSKVIDATIKRLGVVLEPNNDPKEEEGVLNPASTRTRDGKLLLYPRAVAKGNQSRVSIIAVTHNGDEISCERVGFALEPTAPYEFGGSQGNGCEDARVTFIPALDKYIMAYTAYGKQGPVVALAYSDDAYAWTRIGLVEFPENGKLPGGDKDAAFFPEPVISPSGVASLALYHRPMALMPPQGIPEMLAMPHEKRDSIRIAYVPLEAVKKDIDALVKISESHLLLSPSPGDAWGQMKLGGGTVPVRIEEGWLSIYHGVDAEERSGEKKSIYRAGIIVHDEKDPCKIVYRSPKPLLQPENADELVGIVDNVVFPTALDPRPDLGKRVFDIYYGMADFKIGLARLELK